MPNITTKRPWFKSFTAVYICPPYSLLIFKLENGNFMFIDPHPLMHEYGGKLKAAVISARFPG